MNCTSANQHRGNLPRNIGGRAFVQRSTGRTLSFRSANFLRFRNARVVEFREFADTFDVVEQALGRWLVV